MKPERILMGLDTLDCAWLSWRTRLVGRCGQRLRRIMAGLLLGVASAGAALAALP